MPNYISKVRVSGLLLLIEAIEIALVAFPFVSCFPMRVQVFKSSSTDLCTLRYNIIHIAEAVEVEKVGEKKSRVLSYSRKGMLFCDDAPGCQEVLCFNERPLFGCRRPSIF